MVLICFDIHLGVVGSAITKLDTARRTEHYHIPGVKASSTESTNPFIGLHHREHLQAVIRPVLA